jgi:GNAT superfamily N-acetyltransferase
MPGAPGTPVLRALTDPSDLAALHDRVLAPSFPPAELVALGELTRAVLARELRVLALTGDDGLPVAGAVGDWSPASGVLLVLYLAIAPGRRSAGLGGRLLTAALDAWQAELSPVAVLAEVEHPAFHRASPEHGDPVARVRFYARHGGQALAVPYFQPGAGPGAPRVPALLLVALRSAGRVSLPARPVREFLSGYLRACEGDVVDDAPTRALFAALAGDTVPLVPLDEVATAPRSQLPVGELCAEDSSAPSASR